MNVQVFGENDLIRRLIAKKTVYSHCISISNPDEQVPDIIQIGFSHILSLKFSDVEDGPKSPTKQDVQKVIDFYEQTKQEATGYTIHCWHGISRSTAIALGLLYLITGSEEEAVSRLLQLNYLAHPHKQILEYYDAIIGSTLSSMDEIVAKERRVQLKKKILLKIKDEI